MPYYSKKDWDLTKGTVYVLNGISVVFFLGRIHVGNGPDCLVCYKFKIPNSANGYITKTAQEMDASSICQLENTKGV